MSRDQTLKLSPEIIFEDTHLIVLDKPPGLLSQGEHRGEPNLVDWLRGYLGRPYVGLVHRLDRNTSGIMVVGKRSKAASRLTEALQTDELVRIYLGWCVGTLESAATWRHRLIKDRKTNFVRVASGKQEGGAEAVLFAQPVAHANRAGQGLTLIEFKLETGRSHQIRVQAAYEGFPLLGDPKYGRPGGPSFGRPALHSSRLSFPHPMSGERLSFEAPLPPDMAAIGPSR